MFTLNIDCCVFLPVRQAGNIECFSYLNDIELVGMSKTLLFILPHKAEQI